MDPTKKWYQSKLVWSGIVVMVRGIYEGLQTVAPAYFGFNLPPIPPFVDGIIGAILGGAQIKWRMGTDTKIG